MENGIIGFRSGLFGKESILMKVRASVKPIAISAKSLKEKAVFV